MKDPDHEPSAPYVEPHVQELADVLRSTYEAEGTWEHVALAARDRLLGRASPPVELLGCAILDSFDILRWDGGHLKLGKQQAALLRQLAASPGGVVRYEVLYEAGKVRSTQRDFNTTIWQLRRKIEPAGLTFVNTRGIGYALVRKESEDVR